MIFFETLTDGGFEGTPKIPVTFSVGKHPAKMKKLFKMECRRGLRELRYCEASSFWRLA
jgi:hypothetical protein